MKTRWNHETDSVISVCWFCGQQWDDGCIGALIGRRPFLMCKSEWEHWRTTREPPWPAGLDGYGERDFGTWSPIEYAYRRGVHQALSIARQYGFSLRELAIAEQSAFELRYDDGVHPWLLHEIIDAVWHTRLAKNECPMCQNGLTVVSGRNACLRCMHGVAIVNGRVQFEYLGR